MLDGRDGVADLGLANVLEARRHVPDLARDQALDRHELRAEHAQLEELGLGAAGHQPDDVVIVERALGQAQVADDALVRVVVAVEHEPAQRCVRVALGRRDPGDDRLEDLRDARALLGRREDHLLARHREHVLELLDDDVRLRGRQVDLVEHRDDRQPLAQREVDVGQRLGLDALGGVDDEDRALTRLQAAADLVREVDVAGRVDEVQAVRQPVLGGVLEPHRPGLDRDPLLALEVHGVEDLAHHLPAFDRMGQLEQAVRERGLAVIDVGDDRKVAQPVLGDDHEAGV